MSQRDTIIIRPPVSRVITRAAILRAVIRPQIDRVSRRPGRA